LDVTEARVTIAAGMNETESSILRALLEPKASGRGVMLLRIFMGQATCNGGRNQVTTIKRRDQKRKPQ
jgi:hypothetical protein